MRIQREWLGGSEELDLSRPDQWIEFWRHVVQSHDVAVELADRIAQEQQVIVNEDDPLFIERYTLLDPIDVSEEGPTR